MELFLYSKENCHLCEQMHEQLQTVMHRYKFDYHLIKIDDIPELEHRYGARVPVLMADGRLVCEGTFDATVMETFLQQHLS